MIRANVMFLNEVINNETINQTLVLHSPTR